MVVVWVRGRCTEQGHGLPSQCDGAKEPFTAILESSQDQLSGGRHIRTLSTE